MSKLGCAIPKTVLLPQKAYPKDIDLTPESLRNLEYPVDWDALLDYVGRPAILKPYSGGGWKHVYKVNDRRELLEAYDGTAPYCMTLQEFIDFDSYVRCFTFGKTDITPVKYDPRERRYLVEHEYLSSELGARVVGDAQTINRALGYEMNTIEFAVQDGVPYAIDYLNPAPDFERDRITDFYFSHVRGEDEQYGHRSCTQPRSDAQLAALGRDAWDRVGACRIHRCAAGHIRQLVMDAIDTWHSLLRPDVELSGRYAEEFAASMRDAAAHLRRPHAVSVSPAVLPDRS